MYHAKPGCQLSVVRGSQKILHETAMFAKNNPGSSQPGKLSPTSEINQGLKTKTKNCREVRTCREDLQTLHPKYERIGSKQESHHHTHRCMSARSDAKLSLNAPTHSFSTARLHLARGTQKQTHTQTHIPSTNTHACMEITPAAQTASGLPLHLHTKLLVRPTRT